LPTKEDKTERETVVLSCRVSERFAQLVKKFCSLDSHLNPADLMRDSLREKIAKEAPKLYAQMFEEQKKSLANAPADEKRRVVTE
jgi:hypothetical protein